MVRNPLETLFKVRRLLVDQARLSIATCLEAEGAAARRLDLLDAAGNRDTTTEAGFPLRHQFLETTVAWNLRNQAERRVLIAALGGLKAETEVAQTDLANALTSAEVVHCLLVGQRTAREFEAARREQHALDDIARRTKSRGREGTNN